MSVVRCLLIVACCLLSVASWFAVCCLYVVHYVFYDVNGSLFAACVLCVCNLVSCLFVAGWLLVCAVCFFLLLVVRCWFLVVGYWPSFVVCGLLRLVRCVLFACCLLCSVFVVVCCLL